MIVRLVGSTISSKMPRDIDLIAIVTDDEFFKIFGLTVSDFLTMLNTGEWDERMYAWSDWCVCESKDYRCRLDTNKEVDLKVFPETYVKIWEDDKRQKEIKDYSEWKKQKEG